MTPPTGTGPAGTAEPRAAPAEPGSRRPRFQAARPAPRQCRLRPARARCPVSGLIPSGGTTGAASGLPAEAADAVAAFRAAGATGTPVPGTSPPCRAAGTRARPASASMLNSDTITTMPTITACVAIDNGQRGPLPPPHRDRGMDDLSEQFARHTPSLWCVVHVTRQPGFWPEVVA